METLSSVLMAAAAIVFVILLIRILSAPIRGIIKFLLHAAFGYVLLFIASFFGDFVGLDIQINLLSAVIAGFFGVPGVVFLALASLLF